MEPTGPVTVIYERFYLGENLAHYMEDLIARKIVTNVYIVPDPPHGAYDVWFVVRELT